MQDIAYSPLHREASLAASRAQKVYFRLLILQLALLEAPSALAVVREFCASSAWLTAVIGLALFAGAGLTWAMHEQGYLRTWSDCRAVAESVKSTAWRYMMRVPPYDSGGSAKADCKLIDSLREIRQARPGVEHQLVSLIEAPLGSATPSMRRVRDLPLEERKTVYCQQRLTEQATWYAKESLRNRTAECRGVSIVIVAHCVAVILVVRGFYGQFSNVVLAAALMTTAAAFIAWLQAKRHAELVQTYSVVAFELRELSDRIRVLGSEVDLSEVVRMAEGAISREHMIWCAGRDSAAVVRT